MTETTCSGCGTEFAIDRDAVAPGQDTTRCPACGQQNTVAATDGSGEPVDHEDGTVAVDVDDTDELHVHIHIHRD